MAFSFYISYILMLIIILTCKMSGQFIFFTCEVYVPFQFCISHLFLCTFKIVYSVKTFIKSIKWQVIQDNQMCTNHKAIIKDLVSRMHVLYTLHIHIYINTYIHIYYI